MQRCQVEVSQLNHNYNGPKLSSEEFFEKKFRLKNPKHLAFHTPFTIASIRNQICF